MCTFLVLAEAGPEPRLILAGNRDERMDRPAVGPGRLQDVPRIVGGRDAARGGTWLGVTADGFFAGLTNQRPSTLPVPAPRSRGEVVLGVLQAGAVEPALAWLAAVDPRAYAGFNLLFGTAAAPWIAYGRPDRPRVHAEAVPPGAYVLPNDVLGSPAFPKVARVAPRLAAVAGRPWPAVADELAALLADHELPPLASVPPPPPGGWPDHEMRRRLDAVCVHLPGYGTRSATFLALAPGRVDAYLYAPGPPCRAPFADFTSLVASPART